MSRRLREKRNARARNVAALIADLRAAGWDGMACSYGAHDFELVDENLQRCKRCGATYFRPDVVAAMAASVHAMDGLPRHSPPPVEVGGPASPAVQRSAAANRPEPLRPGT